MSDLVPILDILAYGMIGAAVLALLERLVPVVPSYGLFIFLGGALAQRPIDLPLLIVVTTMPMFVAFSRNSASRELIRSDAAPICPIVDSIRWSPPCPPCAWKTAPSPPTTSVYVPSTSPVSTA